MISPGRTSKSMSANSPRRVSPRTDSSGSMAVIESAAGGVFDRGGNTYSIDRPVMRRISSAVGVPRASRPDATLRPSLSTVIRSPMRRISASRCEM